METDTKLSLCFIAHICMSFWQACFYHQVFDMDYLGVVVGVLMFAAGVAFASAKKMWYLYVAVSAVIVSTGLVEGMIGAAIFSIPLLIDFFVCLLLMKATQISNEEDAERKRADDFAAREWERRMSGRP